MELRYFLLSVVLWIFGGASAQEITTSINDDIAPVQTENTASVSEGPVVVLPLAEYNRLLRLNATADQMHANARTYRSIGWIGGGVIAGIGVTFGGFLWGISGMWQYMLVASAPAIICGSLWCLGWNLGANSMVKKARAAETMSASIIKNEVARFGDKSLTAGLNLLSNQLTRTSGVGLSLSLNF